MFICVSYGGWTVGPILAALPHSLPIHNSKQLDVQGVILFVTHDIIEPVHDTL
jgi:hypothetical protein